MKKVLIFIGSPRKDGNTDTAKSLKGLGLIPFKTLVSSKAFNKDSTKNNERVLRKAYKIGQLIQ